MRSNLIEHHKSGLTKIKYYVRLWVTGYNYGYLLVSIKKNVKVCLQLKNKNKKGSLSEHKITYLVNI